MKKGYLIAVEGIDGSGKTTLAHILKKNLESSGFKVIALTSGGTNPSDVEFQLKRLVVSASSNCTANTELLLYFASLSQKYGQHILPALHDGNIIIVDRYIHSYTIFSKYIYHQNDSFTNTLIQFTTNNLQPDFLFLCDLDANIAFKRLCSRGSLTKREQQGPELLSIMRTGFLDEYKKYNGKKEIIHTDVNTIADMEEIINAWKDSIILQ